MPPPAPAPSKRCPGTLICSDAAALGKHGERARHRKYIHTCQPRHEPRECTGSPEGRTDPDTNPTGLPGRGPGGSPHASQASFRCVEAQSPSLRTAVHDRGSPAACRGHSGQSPPARLHFTRQFLVTALARDPLKTTGHPHHQMLTPTKRHGKAGQARPLPPADGVQPAGSAARDGRPQGGEPPCSTQGLGRHASPTPTTQLRKPPTSTQQPTQSSTSPSAARGAGPHRAPSPATSKTLPAVPPTPFLRGAPPEQRLSPWGSGSTPRRDAPHQPSARHRERTARPSPLGSAAVHSSLPGTSADVRPAACQDPTP